ncbi:unnamed protein product [Anisakis simplex]|uniref:Autophagy-related protein 13 n=1 Tax=Anisakis simplex TaxID=6269 RepID=A0A0M3K5R4_ANISI|nr:unnamed protein product [Anisakis simplex]
MLLDGCVDRYRPLPDYLNYSNVTQSEVRETFLRLKAENSFLSGREARTSGVTDRTASTVSSDRYLNLRHFFDRLDRLSGRREAFTTSSRLQSIDIIDLANSNSTRTRTSPVTIHHLATEGGHHSSEALLFPDQMEFSMDDIFESMPTTSSSEGATSAQEGLSETTKKDNDRRRQLVSDTDQDLDRLLNMFESQVVEMWIVVSSINFLDMLISGGGAAIRRTL